jgi:hypothetical protein
MVRIDPVTGNVGIGTPPAQPVQVQEPMHPEIKKMYEDYFDKCFAESSLAEQERVCAWRREDDDHMPDTWRSDCGVMWTFIDGSPVDNDMKYCCGCGAMLLEKKT